MCENQTASLLPRAWNGFPEGLGQDGWHWVRWPNGKESVYGWNAAIQRWEACGDIRQATPEMLISSEAGRPSYLGPARVPTAAGPLSLARDEINDLHTEMAKHRCLMMLARNYLQTRRDEDFASYTVAGDPATMSPEEVEQIDEIEGILADLNVALAKEDAPASIYSGVKPHG